MGSKKKVTRQVTKENAKTGLISLLVNWFIREIIFLQKIPINFLTTLQSLSDNAHALMHEYAALTNRRYHFPKQNILPGK